jgi:hypothetical protein
MKRFWDRIFSLDYETSFWVEEEDLGKEKVIVFFHNQRPFVTKIPQDIKGETTLYLKGRGKTFGNKTGDLILHIWLNRGEDDRKSLWLSESSAKQGTEKKLFTGEKVITIVIPPRSYDGLTIRLKSYGREQAANRRAPTLKKKRRGNLYVKLCVFPDRVPPNYGSFDTLSTENMVLEGWVYRRFDEIVDKIGRSFFNAKLIQAELVADLFNESGWRGIFHALVQHLNLDSLDIRVMPSATIPNPGNCQKTANVKDNRFLGYYYKIMINEEFLDNPFSIAAILAHELCHVVYAERIDPTSMAGNVLKTDKGKLDDERSVDLLVFMFKIGEFQLRVARDEQLTFGYFNQEIFERIQVIASKKLNSIDVK